MKANAVALATIFDQDLPGGLEGSPGLQFTKPQCLGIGNRTAEFQWRHLGPFCEDPRLLPLLLGTVDLPEAERDEQGNRERKQQGRHPTKTKIQLDKPHPSAIFEVQGTGTGAPIPVQKVRR